MDNPPTPPADETLATLTDLANRFGKVSLTHCPGSGWYATAGQFCYPARTLPNAVTKTARAALVTPSQGTPNQ